MSTDQSERATGKDAAGTERPLIALAAGGTGGHMFPAQALAAELKSRDFRILLITDARGERYAEEFPCDEKFLISAATPNVGGPVRKAMAAAAIAGGLIKSMSEFKQRRVAAAIGFGGYPSLPAMKAAAFMKIPYGVHEQNAVLGRSNRVLAKGADFVAHAFPNISHVPTGDINLVEVGNPVRRAVEPFAGVEFSVPAADEPFKLLIFGGSQGASVFANTIPAILKGLPTSLRERVEVVQQARPTEVDAVKAQYTEIDLKTEVAPFFSDLPNRIADAHLVICRSGASTVTELSVIGRPSILVPLPIAMDDHQAGNATVLEAVGAAVMIREGKDFQTQLSIELEQLFMNPGRLVQMARGAKNRVSADASRHLADLVEQFLISAQSKRQAA